MAKLPCDCEHIGHFADAHPLTPLHPYGWEYPADEMVSIKTPYGTYTVCAKCANTCLVGYPEDPTEAAWHPSADCTCNTCNPAAQFRQQEGA